MKLFGYNINIGKVQDLSIKRSENKDIVKRITTPVQLYRTRIDISSWRSAVTSAESIHSPQRYMLYRLYNDVVLDAHLSACMMQRKNLTLSKKFEVYVKGEENEELTKLLKQKWFYDFIDLSLDSLFYGYSLIQFDSLIDDVFKQVDLVPREYVKPEFGIVTSNYSDLSGTSYLEKPYSDWCIGVGKKKDLGLLMKLAPLVIWKKNAMGAWAEYGEVFGVPLRIGKTNVRDEETRRNMELFLKDLGTSSYGVFDTDDLIEIIESGKSDAYQVFDMMVQRCNSEIAKLILGQTGTTDEKSYVGSAEVQERILDMIGKSDAVFIASVINYQLIPMLVNLGIMPIGAYVECEAESELTLIEKSNIDIELIKTGKFTFDPEYLKEKYGSDVIVVEQPKVESTKEVNTTTKVKNSLDKYYK